MSCKTKGFFKKLFSSSLIPVIEDIEKSLNMIKSVKWVDTIFMCRWSNHKKDWL